MVELVVFFVVLVWWVIIIEPAATRWDWAEGWVEFGREWWAHPVGVSVALVLTLVLPGATLVVLLAVFGLLGPWSKLGWLGAWLAGAK